MTNSLPHYPDIVSEFARHRTTPEAAVSNIDWMLKNLQKQFDRISLAPEKRRPTLLAEILPKQEKPMRILGETLQALRAALVGSLPEDALRSFHAARNAATAPELEAGDKSEERDPRMYYLQILEWYPEFYTLRNPAPVHTKAQYEAA